MDKFLVKGGNKPKGVVKVSAAKNSVLPILACCTMCKGQVVLRGISKMGDIIDMTCLLQKLGCSVLWQGDSIVVNCAGLDNSNIDEEYAKRIRASVFLLGPLGARTGHVKLPLPGGCNIGARPIDIHIQGLKSLGYQIDELEDSIVCIAKDLKPNTIKLPFASVGATENIMMAACGIEGVTTIQNVACEPEIVDLANFVNAMGGDIQGAGTSKIVIKGGFELKGGEYAPIGDRIVACTYLVSVCGMGGDVTVQGVDHMTFQVPLKIMQDKGCQIFVGKDFVRVINDGRCKSAKRIVTRPYPDFPTDLQAQFVAMECLANGQTVVLENLFENRFAHIKSLQQMGANINIKGNVATIKGVEQLHASNVDAKDLRGGAALLLATSVATGESTVTGIHHIDRGYYKIEDDLSSLGIDITRKQIYV